MEKGGHALKKEAYALWIATRDPRVPRYAKIFMGLVLAHTFSPIDLIPDFIPVIGLLDDLVVTPIGIVLALKMIPPEFMTDARQKAKTLLQQGKPVNRVGAVMIIGIWLAVLVITVVWAMRTLVR
ncbi:MAG: DUF1232 domain-containing protein [candidate division Zixibacteria bacterium]|nr:DUF1232 domain-containing protein [candidate division Zixibacteria bacterium]